MNLLEIFAGPICEGAECIPLVAIGLLYFIGLYVLGAVLIIIGIFKFVKHRRKGPPQKYLLITLAGVALLLVHPIHNYLENNSRRHAEREELVHISFPVYGYQEPGKASNQYVSTLHKPKEFLSGDLLDFQSNDPKYAHIVERYDTITVRQFSTEKYPGSSETCTPVDPEFPDYAASGYKCEQVGITPQGTKVYAAFSAVDESYLSLFTTIDSTRITVDTFRGDPAMNDTLLEIMKTLEPIDKSELF